MFVAPLLPLRIKMPHHKANDGERGDSVQSGQGAGDRVGCNCYPEGGGVGCLWAAGAGAEDE